MSVLNLSICNGVGCPDSASPMFTLQATVANPSDYTLFFSPGTINQPIGSGVPEPSTWA